MGRFCCLDGTYSLALAQYASTMLCSATYKCYNSVMRDMLGIYCELFDPPFLFLSHGSHYGHVKVFYGFILLFFHYVYTFKV